MCGCFCSLPLHIVCIPRSVLWYRKRSFLYHKKSPKPVISLGRIFHSWYHLNSENLLCTLPIREFLPISLPCNVGTTLKPTKTDMSLLFSFISPFNPLLKGYFHHPFTKIHTSHLLSWHPEIMYSSSSLHFTLPIYSVEIYIYYNWWISLCQRRILDVFYHIGFLMFFITFCSRFWKFFLENLKFNPIL